MDTALKFRASLRGLVAGLMSRRSVAPGETFAWRMGLLRSRIREDYRGGRLTADEFDSEMDTVDALERANPAAPARAPHPD